MTPTRRLSDKPQVPPMIVGLAVAMGIWVTACPTTAQSLSAADFTKSFTGYVYETTKDGATYQVSFGPEGWVAFTGQTGAHEGTWQMAGDEICLDVPGAPSGDRVCGALQSPGGGVIETSTGQRLVRVAKIMSAR